jgi:hypothetical protein
LGPLNAGAHKTSQLNQKMSEISSLHRSLEERIALAVEKNEHFQKKAEDLRQEIEAQNSRLGCHSYQTAVQDPRIDYNLKLIQLLLGYISRLNEKIRYFNNGRELLSFLFQRAQDDLMMIKTLNDLEIDKLIAQINEALDEFSAEVRKPMFDVNDVPLEDTEEIWNEIFQNSKRRQLRSKSEP